MNKIIKYSFVYFFHLINYFKKFYYKKYIFSFFKKLKTSNKEFNFNRVLIDGFWENPNYWLRINLVFKALNLYNAKLIGLLGKYSRKSVKQSFKIFNINELIDTQKINIDKKQLYKKAKYLISNSKSNQDILKWKLPYNFPPILLFDSILKELATPTIELNNPSLVKVVTKLLSEIEISFQVFLKYKFSLFLCSHSIGSTYGSMVWAAIKNKVTVLCLYGDYGGIRFIKYKNLAQLTNHICPVPTKKEFLALDDKSQDKFIKKGKDYLKDRLNSKTTDIGAKLAIHKKKEYINKDIILKHFSSQHKKIITVYTHHWSDFPHSLGLKNFLDFKEWFDITLEQALKSKDYLWLFKGHPISEKYNYSASKILNKYIKANKNITHVKTVPENWDWRHLLDATDYFITCLGSIGFEASALKKHVLISDTGWYGHLGFGKVSNSKSDYIKNLKSNWWNQINLNTSQNNALKFIGIYYSNPKWLSNYIFEDDSEQNNIYINLKKFLNSNTNNFEKEAHCIQAWVKSNNVNYHIFKNLYYKF